MNMRLSCAIRFLTLSLILLCSEYSYSTLCGPTLAEYLSKIQLIKKEHQEMMSHYEQMIKQAKDSQDTEKYKKPMSMSGKPYFFCLVFIFLRR